MDCTSTGHDWPGPVRRTRVDSAAAVAIALVAAPGSRCPGPGQGTVFQRRSCRLSPPDDARRRGTRDGACPDPDAPQGRGIATGVPSWDRWHHANPGEV